MEQQTGATGNEQLLPSENQTDKAHQKPNLPIVPESIESRKYKASGIYTGRSLALMMGFGAPAGVLIALIGVPVGLLVMAVIALLLGIWGGIGTFLGSIATICGGIYFFATAIPILLPLLLAILAYPFVYPAVVGAVIGYVTWLFAKKGKCRSPGVAAAVGLLNALIGYAGLQGFSVLFLKTVHTVGSIADILIIFSQTGSGQFTLDSLRDSLGLVLQQTPGWFFVILGIEALIVALGSIVVASTQVSDTPFCEKCEEWYIDTAEGAFTTSSSEHLIQALESGNLVLLSNVDLTSKEQYPHLAAKLRKCPSCENADYHLAITLGWEEKKTKGTETKIKKKSEAWVTTMVNVEIGKQIEKLLANAPI